MYPGRSKADLDWLERKRLTRGLARPTQQASQSTPQSSPTRPPRVEIISLSPAPQPPPRLEIISVSPEPQTPEDMSICKPNPTPKKDFVTPTKDESRPGRFRLREWKYEVYHCGRLISRDQLLYFAKLLQRG